jgi:hypothetical protein
MNTFARLAAVLALASSTMAITIATPSESALVVCQPILLSWSDGVPPYFPSVVAPGPGQLYKQFDQTDATSLTWKVDIPVGTNVVMAIKDSTGAQQYSGTVTVKPGSDTSCLSASSGTGAPASTGAPTTGAASTTGGASESHASGSHSASATKSSGSAAASSGSSGNNGAMTASASTLGVAAVMGLVGAALF